MMSLLIGADASEAKTELGETGKAARDAGKDVEDLGRTGGKAASGTDKLGDAADRTAADVRSMAAEERAAAKAATQLARQNARAAAATGNLTAQFNDIGVMMASGQNPLQLALQQGTQITQVIGPMGAAGAARALGGAFVSMLNPISFITIGSIAAAAAMSNWLTGADEDAVTLDDAVKDLSGRIDAYSKAAAAANAPTAELREEWGGIVSEVREYLGLQAQLERRELDRGRASGIEQLITDSNIDTRSYGSRDQQRLGELFNLARTGMGSGLNRKKLLGVFEGYQDLADAADKSVEEQRAALARLIVSFQDAAKASGTVSEAEDARLKDLLSLYAELNKAQRASEKADMQGQASPEQMAQGYRRYLQTRMIGEQELADLKKRSAYELYARTRVESDQQHESGQAILVQLQSEAAIRQAIAKYGANSAEVANLRATAERTAAAAAYEAAGYSGTLKDELMAAWDAARGIASANVVGNIPAAAMAAGTLADNLRAAAAAQAMLDAKGPAPDRTALGFGLPSVGDPTVGSGNLTFGNTSNTNRRPVERRFGPTPETKKGKGAKAERDAVEDLIKSLKNQLAIIKETDPVQKEMLRNREALSEATKAERNQVEELIRSRIEEEQRIASVTERTEFYGQTIYDALEGLAFEGDSVIDTLDNIADAIARAAFEAALLGTGPLAGILGGAAGGGGWIGQLIGAIVPGAGKTGQKLPAKAGGGLIYGPGDGTSDDVLMWGSSGEFMMTAQATRSYRHILEAMNAGADIPGFAGGGMIAPPPANAVHAPGGGYGPRPIFQIDNRSSGQVQGEVEETVGPGGQRLYRAVLSDAVGDALTRPGGGAKRAMAKTYGVQPTRVRR